MIRTVIADDNKAFRNRTKDILETDPLITVVGEVNTGEEAIRIAREIKPDLILMDVRMPVLDGINATKILKEEMSEIKIIILTIYDLDEYKNAAFKNGADEFMIKKRLYKELVPTIYRVQGIK